MLSIYRSGILAIILSMIFQVIAIASPQDGTSPLLVFRNGATRSNEVIYTKISNIQAPDVAVEFIPVNGDRVADHYTIQNGELTYDPPVPSNLPVPNVPVFKTNLFNSENIPALAKTQLILYFPLVEQYANQPPLLQAAWGAIKSSGYTWLTAEIITEVEALAAAQNIELVPAE